MGFTFEVRFTGLCAIIPEEEIGNPQNEASIVLVNARNSPHGSHRSILLFDTECYIEPNTGIEGQPGDNRPVSTVFTFDSGESRGVILDGEELIIMSRNARNDLSPLPAHSLSFVVGTRPYPAQPCPEESDQSDFTWVAKNPGYIDPAVLTNSNLGYLIATRLRLTAGVFSTDKFRLSPQGRVRWWFDGAESTALAEQVVCTQDFDQHDIAGITITSVPFEGYPQQPNLHLKPRRDGVILVWIVNMRPEDISGLEQPSRPFEPDHHYEEFYRLCWGSPRFPIPQPDRSNFCPPRSAASNPKCPPTYFSPLTFQSAFAAVSGGLRPNINLRERKSDGYDCKVEDVGGDENPDTSVHHSNKV